jgi:hypothetical protein
MTFGKRRSAIAGFARTAGGRVRMQLTGRPPAGEVRGCVCVQVPLSRRGGNTGRWESLASTSTCTTSWSVATKALIADQ